MMCFCDDRMFQRTFLGSYACLSFHIAKEWRTVGRLRWASRIGSSKGAYLAMAVSLPGVMCDHMAECGHRRFKQEMGNYFGWNEPNGIGAYLLLDLIQSQVPKKWIQSHLTLLLIWRVGP